MSKFESKKDEQMVRDAIDKKVNCQRCNGTGFMEDGIWEGIFKCGECIEGKNYLTREELKKELFGDEK